MGAKTLETSWGEPWIRGCRRLHEWEVQTADFRAEHEAASAFGTQGPSEGWLT